MRLPVSVLSASVSLSCLCEAMTLCVSFQPEKNESMAAMMPSFQWRENHF